jgi:hypothetical protein
MVRWKKALSRLWDWFFGLFTVAYLSLGLTAIWGCSSVMPVVVHPATDLILEGETPSIEMFGVDVTVDGVYQARLYPARKILPEVFDDADKQHERSKSTADMLQQIIASTGLLSVGAYPYALRKPPKGYTKTDV